MMKEKLFLALAVGLLCACSEKTAEPTSEMVTVNVNMSGFEVETEQMTRATAPVSDYCTHLDVWITDGTSTTAINQAQGDEGFGSLNLTLIKGRQYTMYAVAHKANGPATLSNGIISWPDDKVTHSFYYTTTFTPSENTSLDCVMNRIVAMFRLETLDAIKDEVKKIRITIDDVYDRWNVTGVGTHKLNRVSTININSKNQDGTVSVTCYAIVTNESTNHAVKMEALDANDAVLKTHSMTVPLCINKRTIVRGAFFPDVAQAFSFLAADWEELTSIDF